MHLKLPFEDYITILVHQADLTFKNYIKNNLAPHNLAPEQTLIMMLLWEKDGLSQNEIAEKLNKDKTNIARMVANLEQKGFIRRVSGGKDWRALEVYLTDEGKELGGKVIPIADEFNERVCRGVSKEELTMLKKILSIMCANVR
jgi:DNA-binding MarR family transcriptional regulator